MEYGYRGPAIDHSLLSPSGRMSKRARKAAHEREEARVAAWWAKKYPAPSPEEQASKEAAEKRERLLRTAANLEDLANRGMHPRKYRKEAARLRKEATPA